MQFPVFSSDDYLYQLPAEQIANFPATRRDESHLLLACNEPFSIAPFHTLRQWLPTNAVLINNNTRVIPARLVFRKSTGARIEIFLLQPSTHSSFQQALGSRSPVSWKVLIGNAAKWKTEKLTLCLSETCLIAERAGDDVVQFSWNTEEPWEYILEKMAHIPLPPYINRADQPEDRQRYQTVFARNEGSVAAPTAGLHFTNELLHEMQNSNIPQVSLTLHVGLGTFRPVKGSIAEHTMHCEPFHVSAEQLKSLGQMSGRNWVITGTTTLRALESLFIAGTQLLNGKSIDPQNIEVHQWDLWNSQPFPFSRAEVFAALYELASKQPSLSLSGNTSLLIARGAKVHCADFLITNFHQPGSTLLMLVDAFASVNWKRAYAFALENRMRFLSYGDACLFRNIHSTQTI